MAVTGRVQPRMPQLRRNRLATGPPPTWSAGLVTWKAHGLLCSLLVGPKALLGALYRLP